MDIDGDGIFKICVHLPEEFLERMMDSVNSAMEPIYKGYDRAFGYSKAVGTWRPLDGSNPYKGAVGIIETTDEVRLEFAVHGRDLKAVVKIIADVHPYEEPAIDIIPMCSWKDVI
ncbi:MAG: hypothetical protein LBV13_03660 [Methanomassiliicoccaceae archaeon]|jgi:hypothetical protein|nr:hypothetical protein [Methanomassiliicoccaceae archaeon]